MSNNQRIAATPSNFPCGPTTNAKKHIRSAFQNSSDARSTITTFQRDNSLHCMFAKAFGTHPIHEKKKDDVEVEPLDPSPVLEFLGHLNVTRHEVHSRVAVALRSAIEDEILRMPLPSSGNSLSFGEAGHTALLNLLKSVWQFRDVPELRPILVCLLKRLGDHTPVQMLRRLGVKKAAEKEGDAKKDGELKNAELLSQLGPHISRLVWEANWDERLEAVTARYAGKKAALSGPVEEELTLRGPTILADLISASVHRYLNDPILVHSADLSFVASVGERRFATKSRRMADPSQVVGSVGALSAIGAIKASEEDKTPKPEKVTRPSAAAVASIKETIGRRPKLLGAALDMLISEHALTGGGLGCIKTMSVSGKKKEALKENSAIVSILGGSTNLNCSLVSDILLTFGQLPRSYEVIGIMARILDASVQAGSISDIAVVQVQGCCRSIFRPEQADELQQSQSSSKAAAEPDGAGAAAGGPKIKLSLKAAKTPTSMFPDLPVDDSEYEKKILQRVIKPAIVAMKTNDSQGLFLNPVTDAIAPGYSSIIKEPMCIRQMEEKMMECQYKKIDEFKDDTMLMYSNCVTYNQGPAGAWFRDEAARQKKLWKETIYPDAKTKLKTALDKRRKALKQVKAAESGGKNGGSKKRKKPPPPLAFGLSEKSAKAGAAAVGISASKDVKDDAAINNLTINDVDPLPPWNKRRKKGVDYSIPSMQCLAAMLLADPFVIRILLDKILRTIRIDVKEKSIPSCNTLLPSMFQLINIAKMSVQLCAMKGRNYSIPDAGISSTAANGAAESLPYQSIRQFLPLFSKMLLDAEIDRRMVATGDLHDINGLFQHPELQKKEWNGASSLHDLKVVVEGSFISLLLPGNSNELALRHQFPRFVAALDALSGGNMLNERCFYLSLTTALLRYKSKLPHGIRDMVTSCLINWLRMAKNISPEARFCSGLHEALVNLLNEWSSLGNLVLPRDLFLNLAEEAVAAADGKDIGPKSDLLAKLWNGNDAMFSPIKEQYQKMLSSTPDSKATNWREKMGIAESTAPASPEEGEAL